MCSSRTLVIFLVVAWGPHFHPAGGSTSAAQQDARLEPYLEVIKREGVDPVRFVDQALDRYGPIDEWKQPAGR